MRKTNHKEKRPGGKQEISRGKNRRKRDQEENGPREKQIKRKTDQEVKRARRTTDQEEDGPKDAADTSIAMRNRKYKFFSSFVSYFRSVNIS